MLNISHSLRSISNLNSLYGKLFKNYTFIERENDLQEQRILRSEDKVKVYTWTFANTTKYMHCIKSEKNGEKKFMLVQENWLKAFISSVY